MYHVTEWVVFVYLRNKTSVRVFYRRIKYRYEFGCVWFKSGLR